MATYMCPNCFKLYNSISLRPALDNDGGIYYTCPSIMCHQFEDNLVELDDNIAMYISILNKLGYYTRACCGGHIYDTKLDIYIFFYKNYHFKKIPKHWKYDDDGMNDTIRFDHCENIDISREEVICRAMLDLREWVLYLKENK